MIMGLIILGIAFVLLLPFIALVFRMFCTLLQDVIRGELDEGDELGLAILSIMGIGFTFWGLITLYRA